MLTINSLLILPPNETTVDYCSVAESTTKTQKYKKMPKSDHDIPSYKMTVQSTDEVTPVEVDPLETAKWTHYLPETFGIRDTVRQSNYRWCFRESYMWGIATGTTMSMYVIII